MFVSMVTCRNKIPQYNVIFLIVLVGRITRRSLGRYNTIFNIYKIYNYSIS